MVDIEPSFMLRLSTKPVALLFSAPGSSAFVGQLRQNEAHLRLRGRGITLSP
jgi:hypothetical protein